MKSIRVHQFGEPDVLVLEDVPDPIAAAGQIVVNIRAVGVNPVETYIRKGIAGPVQFPYTPGTDAAGIVESIGDGVNRCKPGGRVYLSGSLSGTYAQKALCMEKHVFHLPDNIGFPQGAAIGVPYVTAYRAVLVRGSARPGQTVFIHGASGGVGIAAVQIARAAGCTVIGTAGTEPGRRLVREQGAHHVLDHTAPDYLTQLMDLTAGAGVNVIIEMLANVNLAKDLTIVAKSGHIVVVGSRGPVEINPRDGMTREADIHTMRVFNAPDADLQSHNAALVAGLENGTLRPIIRTELPLFAAPKAHELVMQPGACGKIVLIP
ncbi:MAG: NADPH:quinone reductase [Tepidisphaeraceae bacterium]|jgi:NADPH2:quinone reductase